MPKCNKLLLIRHGIRGVPLGNDCPLLASAQNITNEGHRQTYYLGKYIKRKYGKPSLIYPDIASDRTIDSAIDIAKSCKVARIFLPIPSKAPLYHETESIKAKRLIGEHRYDEFFDTSLLVPKDFISKSQEKLLFYHSIINNLTQKTKTLFPNITIPDSTTIDEQGKTVGSIEKLKRLYTIAVFTKLSHRKHPLLKLLPLLAPIRNISYTLNNPTYQSIKPIGDYFLPGLIHFLKTEPLSIIVGHDNNVSLLSYYLHKKFSAPEYGLNYIPPDSGFILTLDESHAHIIIEIIYQKLSNRKFKIIPYLTIGMPPDLVAPPFNLIPHEIVV